MGVGGTKEKEISLQASDEMEGEVGRQDTSIELEAGTIRGTSMIRVELEEAGTMRGTSMTKTELEEAGTIGGTRTAKITPSVDPRQEFSHDMKSWTRSV